MSRLAAAGFDEGFKCLRFRLELWQPFLDDSSFTVSLKGVRAVGDAKPPDFGSAKGLSDFHAPHACMFCSASRILGLLGFPRQTGRRG